MPLIDLVKHLETKTDDERRAVIAWYLDALGVKYVQHKYPGGSNIMVDIGNGPKKIGVSSHYDRVKGSPGANDNGSAIAVCIDIIRRHLALTNNNIGLRVFFFDGEETGLTGSNAYVSDYGINGLAGLINMEMVGLGDKFAIWPRNDNDNMPLVKTFEAVAHKNNTITQRFDKIVTNTADHLPFRQQGLQNCFSITGISSQDIAVAETYYKALYAGAGMDKLGQILRQAPLFKNYHQPTDTYNTLNETSLEHTSAVVWETVLAAHGIKKAV